MKFETDEIKTLGDLYEVLDALRLDGWTRASVEYVVERTWG